MEDTVKKRKKREQEEEGYCDAVEGCRTLDIVESAANRRAVDMTRDFIRSVFRKNGTQPESSGEEESSSR